MRDAESHVLSQLEQAREDNPGRKRKRTKTSYRRKKKVKIKYIAKGRRAIGLRQNRY